MSAMGMGWRSGLQLIDILRKYNVKATFFVISTGYNHLLKDIAAAGHSIGIHSTTHKYAQIYSSTDAYFNDLYTMRDIIYNYTGIKTNLMRFPGGGSNTISLDYCPGIMSELTKDVQACGFKYFDWNVSSGDAGGTEITSEVVQNVISGVKKHDVSVVLQHDIKNFSVNAVEEIIKNQEECGYFNSHFLVKDGELRFRNRDCHELYCAGHLMEAAVAYYESTGKDAFLKAMCKYANYI